MGLVEETLMPSYRSYSSAVDKHSNAELVAEYVEAFKSRLGSELMKMGDVDLILKRTKD